MRFLPLFSSRRHLHLAKSGLRSESVPQAACGRTAAHLLDLLLFRPLLEFLLTIMWEVLQSPQVSAHRRDKEKAPNLGPLCTTMYLSPDSTWVSRYNSSDTVLQSSLQYTPHKIHTCICSFINTWIHPVKTPGLPAMGSSLWWVSGIQRWIRRKQYWKKKVQIKTKSQLRQYGSRSGKRGSGVHWTQTAVVALGSRGRDKSCKEGVTEGGGYLFGLTPARGYFFSLIFLHSFYRIFILCHSVGLSCVLLSSFKSFLRQKVLFRK